MGQVTFSKDVAHRLHLAVSATIQTASGHSRLLTYTAARQHATQMALVTRNRPYAPWKVEPGPGDRGLQPLSASEIDLIQQWVAQGPPRVIDAIFRPSPTGRKGGSLAHPI